ncbi:MAG: DUF3089 domain-containing protein [Euryhalocaulis sp.]|uniref:DUF3089 domain-containing protein n=1 Tax=Euryhalocaulis sp. TaxID=2744307 RepID=UPI0018552249|nr:DUF3089 domain-containing protein [Euryhalocaulis sp.]MBA4802902.1 DUF3089 domain-containing protein [Euryhalocaulis sp.]
MHPGSFLKRRWRLVTLIAAAVFLCLLVAAAIGLRDNIFRAMKDPGQPFQTYEPPPQPDYADAANWALRPASSEGGEPAYVFFIHPTTYWGGNQWNAATDKPKAKERLEQVMLPNHAAPFSGAGEIYAPRYRQASLYSFLTNRDDARRARQLAYGDVQRAFAQFLEEAGDDSAIVIAGVEQGGLHAVRLLQDEIGPDPDLRERMAAAYIIDSPLPLDLFDQQLSMFDVCDAPGEYRCVAAWSSARPDDLRTIRHLTVRPMIWTGNGDMTTVEDRPLLCVNPLLWSTKEDFAPARLNQGAAAAEGMEPTASPSLTPGVTSAQCEDGVLLVERPDQSEYRRPLSLGGRYKPAPFNLFYGDIRANARQRVQAFLPVLAEDLRMADPIEETVDLQRSPIKKVPD